jgi:hypothetical protein
MYAMIFEKHFGYKPRERTLSSKRTQAALEKARAVCEEKSLDLAVWITAQMHAFQNAKVKDRNGRKLAFQSNWLGGPKALDRYQVYTQWAKRKFNRPREDAFDSRTRLGVLRLTLAGDEERIAHAFVFARAQGEPITWDAAVIDAEPGPEWLAVAGQVDDLPVRHCRTELETRFGRETLQRERRRAQLTAAWNIAQGIQHGLPDRMSIAGDFSWKEFADFVARLLRGRPEPVEPDLDDLDGTLWGSHDRRKGRGRGTQAGGRRILL